MELHQKRKSENFIEREFIIHHIKIDCWNELPMLADQRMSVFDWFIPILWIMLGDDPDLALMFSVPLFFIFQP